jgi:hypothetical protein
MLKRQIPLPINRFVTVWVVEVRLKQVAPKLEEDG